MVGTAPIDLTLDPLPVSSIPALLAPTEDLAAFFSPFLHSAAAVNFSISSTPWKSTKTYPAKARSPPILTFSTSLNGNYWVARRSTHVPPPSYATFITALLHDKARQELEYIPTVSAVSPVRKWAPFKATDEEGRESVIEAGVWDIEHKLTWPLRRRVFRLLVVTGWGTAVSVPVEVPEGMQDIRLGRQGLSTAARIRRWFRREERKVRGVYVAAERVLETPEGEVEWTAATASDARGWVPQWVQNLGLAATVVQDVPAFLKWIERRGKEKRRYSSGGSV